MFTTRYRDQLTGAYSDVEPTPLADPYWVGWNEQLAEQMSIPLAPNDQVLKVLAGQAMFEGCVPIAQKYAGHQFGVWNPELGDGRGLLLGEWRANDEPSWELHLKGAGRTPYSRFGDGRAVLRSSIREFIGSEALNALGIASTRALGLIGSTEQIPRETMEPGAALLRVTQSHIRFGHFEWFAWSEQHEMLQKLVEFVVEHHFPGAANVDDPVLALYQAVLERTANMVAGWQAYGFVHGVMNTDNMSILGETFDFGPYAFLDATNLTAVFNHTDQLGRYAFHQQPSVAMWNLQRLGQALSVLSDAEKLTDILATFSDRFAHHYRHLMTRRFGGSLDSPLSLAVIEQWLHLLAREKHDFHLPFQQLTELHFSDWLLMRDQFVDRDGFTDWLEVVSDSIEPNDVERMSSMRQVNPLVVPRTHHLQRVIQQAEQGNFRPLESLLHAVQSPFSLPSDSSDWHLPPVENSSVVLSCSS